MVQIDESLKREIEKLKATSEELHTKIVVLERVVANMGPGTKGVLRLRILEPKPFNGARDTKVFVLEDSSELG